MSTEAGAIQLTFRENPGYYRQTMFDLRSVQRGREVDEKEVIAINYVIKTGATRYVGATEVEWLYPERHVKKTPWPKLGGSYFLCPDPRKVSFTTSLIAGFREGCGWGKNEYGHHDLDDPRAQALRDVEWGTFQGAKRAWDERDRVEGREAPQDLNEYF